MSCPSPSAPLNLVVSSANKCILQCSFSFDYKPENVSLIVNYAEDAKIHCFQAFLEKATCSSTVRFASISYTPTYLFVCVPGLHTFDGERAKAELLIQHTGVAPRTTESLFVSIPIAVSNFDYNDDLDQLISVASSGAPSNGEETSGAPVGPIDLQRIVPIAPFFSYGGTNVVTSCDTVTYVAYGLDSSVSVSANAFQQLSKIIPSKTLPTVSSATQYQYNPNGPALSSSDETYMECAPTGSSKDKVMVDQPSTGQNGWLKGSKVSYEGAWDKIKMVLFAFLGVIVFFLLLKLYDVIRSKVTGKGGDGPSVASLTKDLEKV